MAISDIQLTVLGIINEVERRQGYDVSTSVVSTNNSNLLLNWLNDTVAEVSDYGDWQEMYREVDVTASANEGEYKVIASAEVKNVYEISHSQRGIAPLQNRPIHDILRLQRISGNGVPSQYAIVGVSATRPKFRVYNVPGTGQQDSLFTVHFYKKPRLYTTADGIIRVPFPSRVLVKGVYAKAQLEESGQEPTAQYQVALQDYVRERREAHNRFNADTDKEVFLVPRRGYR